MNEQVFVTGNGRLEQQGLELDGWQQQPDSVDIVIGSAVIHNPLTVADKEAFTELNKRFDEPQIVTPVQSNRV